MVYLIGTNHELQHDARPKRAPPDLVWDARRRFGDYVRATASRVRAMTIAEEFAEDVLSALCAKSLCQEIAKDLGIAHVFCEPGRAKRADLEIPLDGTEDLPESERERVHGIRETFWIGELDRCAEEPDLFVCGADHVVGFSNRLADQGRLVRILCTYWGNDIYPYQRHVPT